MSLLYESHDDKLLAFIIDLNKRAKNLSYICKKIISTDDDGSFMNKVVTSSDDSKIKAYVTNKARKGIFKVKVIQLADCQENLSKIVYEKALAIIDDGKHTFTVAIGEKTIELAVNIKSSDTNGAVLRKLKEVIEEENIGIEVFIEKYVYDKERLILKSKIEGKNNEFSIFDKEGKIVSYTGIWNKFINAQNTEFTINDKYYESQNDTALLDKENIMLKIKSITKYQNVIIKIFHNTDVIKNDMMEFIDFYNELVKMLRNDMIERNAEDNLMDLAKKYKRDLSKLGLIFNYQYMLKLNMKVFIKKINNDYEKIKGCFFNENNFLLRIIEFCKDINEEKIILVNHSKEDKKDVSKEFIDERYDGYGKLVKVANSIGEKIDFIC
ncbi:hypothetical protein OW763_07590 [Clostridium aestuarii]|uniref:Flagellar hook-associated protein 2 C-terminal domain-containing protein n=1 Tax=Clostridium aestuarii TaxID=338193 RepID=A0ABT4CZ03_9CLOT|nr:hypothetical protein [Clostridium aestuarii]MCY6484217.1 hypothetical protein [Clostridium aestuarii]